MDQRCLLPHCFLNLQEEARAMFYDFDVLLGLEVVLLC